MNARVLLASLFALAVASGCGDPPGQAPGEPCSTEPQLPCQRAVICCPVADGGHMCMLPPDGGGCPTLP